MSVENFRTQYVDILEGIGNGAKSPKPLPHMQLSDIIEHFEQLLSDGNFDDRGLVRITNFIDDVKRSLVLKKISESDLGMSQSMIVRDILGTFTTDVPDFYMKRERYFPFMMFGESPYHKISVDEFGGIKFSYERNTPVISLPIIETGGVEPGKPSAIEMILWELSRNARKKYINRINNSTFYRRLTEERTAKTPTPAT